MLNSGKVGGSRNVNVWLNLTDLTQFSFPRIVDPRESGNLSDWYEAIGLVTRLQDGIDDLKDPSEIKQHELFAKKKGFSLRLTVVPLAMGLVTVWLGAAPGTPDMIKKVAVHPFILLLWRDCLLTPQVNLSGPPYWMEHTTLLITKLQF